MSLVLGRTYKLLLQPGVEPKTFSLWGNMADQPVVNPQLKLPVICKLFLLDTFNCSRLSFTG